jgi:ElaB/YqjD/DUF883 family membrane-anchored ribosome-binding protein
MRTETQDAKDRLIEEFKKVMDNAEELLKATADQTGDEIGAARARAEESLREARRKLGEIEGTLIDRTKAAAKAADHLVREKPWQSITAATAVGVILGMLISRR